MQYQRAPLLNISNRPLITNKNKAATKIMRPTKVADAVFPNFVLQNVLSFAQTNEIIYCYSLVSKRWNHSINAPCFWNSFIEARHLELIDKIRLTSLITERRSKGKMYNAIVKANQLPCIARIINFEVSNANIDDGVPSSIMRELSIMKNINHINCGRLIDYEVKDKTMMIVYEKYKETLSDFIKSLNINRTLQQNGSIRSTTRSIAKQLLSAADYLYQIGVIHRNYKPENIFVENGNIKVSDFTMSRYCVVPLIPYTPEDPKERERSARESKRLWYRAPELLLRKNLYSYEIDIWSIGCLIAEIALGEPLFNGDSEIDQLLNIFNLLGVPEEQAWSNICPDLLAKAKFPKWECADISKIVYNTNSPEFRKLVSQYLPDRENAFIKLFKLGKVLGKKGIELLRRMLSLDPRMRPTYKECTEHSFFDKESAQMNTDECDDVVQADYYTVEQIQKLYQFMITKQKRLKSYLNSNEAINENMRTILIDWLIDVAIHFELKNATLHMAVKYIDEYLGKCLIAKSKLQLLGVTCMKLADVFNEKSNEFYRQENTKEYVYITADEYKQDDLKKMEKEIIKLRSYDMLEPTLVHFVDLYLTLIGSKKDVNRMANYICDLMLLCYDSINFTPSLLAASVVYYATTMCNYKIAEGKMALFNSMVRANDQELIEATEYIQAAWNHFKSIELISHLNALKTKYSDLDPTSLSPPMIDYILLKKWSAN